MNSKQPFHLPDNGTLQQFSSILQGTFSPTSSFNDLYTNLWPQNSMDRADNKSMESPYTLPDHSSLKSVELSELATKEFSTGSYCNTVNSTATPMESQYCRFANHQWNSSYSSCAQVSQFYGESCAQPAYCNVPKGNKDYKGCSFYDSNFCYPQGQSTKSVTNYPDLSSENGSFNYNQGPYVGSLLTETEKQPFNHQYEMNFVPDFPPIDIQAEGSNEESDIVVEDSSSESTEPDHQQMPLNRTTKCLVCNNQYSLGVQFYVLTAKNPLTMSSQIPVKDKISQFLSKDIFSAEDYLCNDCLGLINSIDHLQLKVENLVKSLVSRVKVCLKKSSIYVKKTRPKYAVKFKCKQCCRVLNVNTFLDNHSKKHKIRVFLCELCGKKLQSMKRLHYHLKCHQNMTEAKTLIPAFMCKNRNCRKLFRTKPHLKEHENFCLGLLPFKCKNPHCNKKFASSTKLKHHTKLKHEKKFVAICSICNIGFVKLSEYKSHKITHSSDKKFSCSKCDKSYKTLSNLNFHLKSHEKVLPYVCFVCNKGFMRREYHDAHMNNHKGLKNFSCSVCEKKFVSQKNLDAHAKLHEGTAKSNTCNICKKVITSCFEEHLRVHLNLKEFECDSCDMKFNTKNSLSKHKKKKHAKVDGVVT